ncbi:putative tetratricopeptide-like helical domain superfamily [Helianthus anomalus]
MKPLNHPGKQLHLPLKFQQTFLHYKRNELQNLLHFLFTLQMGLEVLSSILHQCSKTRSFRHGFSLHAVAIKMCFISNVIISNHVLNMYAKCGKNEYARQVFDEMYERNVVSWSAMISEYDQVGRALNAIQLFSRMKVEQTNEFVFASVVSACASLLAVDFNLIEDAEKIFWLIEKKYMISWNTFIAVCCHALDHAKCLSVFSKMIKTHSLTLDNLTYTSAKSTNHSAKLQLSFSVKI